MTHNVSLPAGPSAAPYRCGLAAAAAAASTALWMAGCTQALPTRLPELASITRKVLNDEEQKKAIDELTAKKETHHGEAIQQIEKVR